MENMYSFNNASYEQCHEKICLWDLRPGHTLMQSYKRARNIFTLVQKVKINYVFFFFINKPRLFRGSLSYFFSK